MLPPRYGLEPPASALARGPAKAENIEHTRRALRDIERQVMRDRIAAVERELARRERQGAL